MPLQPGYDCLGEGGNPKKAAEMEPETNNKGKALVVDDDPEVRVFLRYALEVLGYDSDEAEDGRHAVKLLAASNAEYDVIVTDVEMPWLGGAALYEACRQTRPELCDHFVFVTGGGHLIGEGGFLSQTGQPYLLKPFSVKRLHEAVLRVVKRDADVATCCA